MFKKIILGLCFLACSFIPVLADSAPISEDEIREVEAFFNSYVNSANNYEDILGELYTSNADIKRVVIKTDGEKETVTIPMERYKQELRKGKTAAKLVKYKNRYENKKYEKISDSSYKVMATRYPRNDQEGLYAEFIITRTPSGLKISGEKMETTVQRFLEEK